jgi:hypothetical protein
VENFVQCVKERRATISSEDVGPYTSVLCQLVHMSYVHDTGFDWDPKKMTFANGTGNPSGLSRLEIPPGCQPLQVQPDERALFRRRRHAGRLRVSFTRSRRLCRFTGLAITPRHEASVPKRFSEPSA